MADDPYNTKVYATNTVYSLLIFILVVVCMLVIDEMQHLCILPGQLHLCYGFVSIK